MTFMSCPMASFYLETNWVINYDEWRLLHNKTNIHAVFSRTENAGIFVAGNSA